MLTFTLATLLLLATMTLSIALLTRPARRARCAQSEWTRDVRELQDAEFRRCFAGRRQTMANVRGGRA